MKTLLLASAFLLIAVAIAVLAAIPLLVTYARRQHEIANAISASTKIRVSQYSTLVKALDQTNRAVANAVPPPPPAPRKPPRLRPIGGNDGSSKKNDYPRPPRTDK